MLRGRPPVGVYVTHSLIPHLATVMLDQPRAGGVGGGPLRLGATFLMCVVLVGAWLPIRAFARRRTARGGPAVVLVAIVVSAAVIAGILGAGHSGSQNSSRGGLTHGRTHEWRAAFDTWLDRPLIGAGANSYFAASVKHQGSSPSRFAHNLPLELAAELGVLGLILGIGLYAAALRVLQRARASPSLWLLGPAVAAFLVANLVDWSWHLAGLGAAWAAAAGALEAARR
jgi:O-antigen ligase